MASATEDVLLQAIDDNYILFEITLLLPGNHEVISIFVFS